MLLGVALFTWVILKCFSTWTTCVYVAHPFSEASVTKINKATQHIKTNPQNTLGCPNQGRRHSKTGPFCFLHVYRTLQSAPSNLYWRLTMCSTQCQVLQRKSLLFHQEKLPIMWILNPLISIPQVRKGSSERLPRLVRSAPTHLPSASGRQPSPCPTAAVRKSALVPVSNEMLKSVAGDYGDVMT